MKVSLNIIKQFIDVDLPPIDELVARVNAQLGGVEEVINLGEKYKDACIVRVASAEKHPDADKLTVCKVDDGGAVEGIDRDENGYVQVVCGAPNVAADMWAVWLPPKATVPSTYGDAEPFVLDARKLRGVLSQGMLAAGDELAINSDHDGIIALEKRDLPNGKTLQAGASFADVFDLNGYVIDIENKMFTHRPDLFGQLGVAREIDAILKGVTTPEDGFQDTRYKNPDWYWDLPQFSEIAESLPLETFNDAPKNVPRIMFAVMKDVQVAPSPLWFQCALVAMGAKPVNNVVDATNYLMLLTAQPTHAYDYDKIRGQKIGARMATQGEKITLLNDKTYELTGDDIVIADAEGPIGLAGIMGGADSEVSESTKTIVLEVATFDMYAVRKTAMRHGVFTDALARFNKGQSPLQNGRIVQQLMHAVADLAGATQASNVRDEAHTDWNQEVTVHGEIVLHTSFITDRLGVALTTDQIGNLLRRVNFASFPAEDDKDTLHITAPFWRTDIEYPEDIVEEVGRLYGFDKLPRELLQRSTKPAPKNPLRETKQLVRASLSRAGANEVLTYSFVHENIFKKSEQDASEAFKVSNALSPDLQYYRLTVLPSLLDKVHANIKAGHDEFTLFEIGKGHNKKHHADDDEGLPGESNFVDMVYASKEQKDGAPYYRIRRFVEQLGVEYGLELRYKPAVTDQAYPVTAPFDLERSALIETADGTFIGLVGELKQSVVKSFKLPQYVAAATLDTEGIHTALSRQVARYTPLSRYPSVSRDVSVSIEETVSYETVQSAAQSVPCGRDIVVKVILAGIYQPKNATTKNVTLHVTVTPYERTLSGSEANDIVASIADAVCRATNGTIV
ncbi:MAG: phenylalanine--tRNA ligase subunit beta [Candidatus Saccharimonadales bacterium]